MRRAVIYVVVVLIAALVIYAFQPPKQMGEGDAAPNITLNLLNGETRSLADYKGKVVVLDFWATWCAPCRFTTPKMIQFHNRHRDQNVVVIGVAVDVTSRDEIEQFVREIGINYPIAVDTDTAAKGAYQIRSLPTLFVIDKEGNILRRLEGYDPQNTIQTLEETVKRAL
ncbi:MAG: TlpA disulfide reductase family protein [Armatimonadota bacterium]|nr:TlpA disulfide reductase family protein [Armatimonadota bacterium]